MDNITAAAQPELTIRLYQDEDAEALTELLHRAYAELGAAGLNYTAVDQDVATTHYRATSGQCWVAEIAGELVATVTISLPPSQHVQELTEVARVANIAWLNQLAVDPTKRGRGTARYLWLTALSWAAENGATSVGLDTAQEADHLVSLYTSWGLRPADTIHWPGKTYDSVVMLSRV